MPNKNLLDKIFIAAVLVILLFYRSAYCGDFVLNKVGSHYAPVPHLLEPEIKLRGAEIKAASYSYISDSDKEHEVGRLGFFIEDKKFYFVDSDGYNLYGDSHFGLYNNFFIMDSWGYGSVSGHVRLMFLCKYSKDSVQLLDVIGVAHIGTVVAMDFISSYKKKDIFGENAWTEIKDIDHDGNPEIKIDVSTDSHYFIPIFNLYFEIKDKRLSVDLNPELYKPLFEHSKKKNRGNNKTDDYYIYGFLSGRLKLEDIKEALLKLDHGDSATSENFLERYIRIMTILENINNWDEAFHYIYDQKFELMEYNLNRR